MQEKRPINAFIIYSINDKNMNQDRTSPWISPKLSQTTIVLRERLADEVRTKKMTQCCQGTTEGPIVLP